MKCLPFPSEGLADKAETVGGVREKPIEPPGAGPAARQRSPVKVSPEDANGPHAQGGLLFRRNLQCPVQPAREEEKAPYHNSEDVFVAPENVFVAPHSQ